MTNTVFGLLRCYMMLAVGAGAGGVVVDLDAPLAERVDVAGATLVATEADGCRLVYALSGVSAGPLVARLATAGSLRDLSVVEPAIEDVVARLYRSPSDPSPPDPVEEVPSPVKGAP